MWDFQGVGCAIKHTHDDDDSMNANSSHVCIIDVV